MSALDVHVGSHLFEDGILRWCLKRKRTVVLITHQLQYLKNAHKVSHYCTKLIIIEKILKIFKYPFLQA